MENNYADSVWNYFENEVYENKDNLSGYDLDMDKLDCFVEWLNADGKDYIWRTIPIASETDDVEIIEKEIGKAIDLMIKGANKAQELLMRKEFMLCL